MGDSSCLVEGDDGSVFIVKEASIDKRIGKGCDDKEVEGVRIKEGGSAMTTRRRNPSKGEVAEEVRVILDKDSTLKDMRREGEEG